MMIWDDKTQVEWRAGIEFMLVTSYSPNAKFGPSLIWECYSNIEGHGYSGLFAIVAYHVVLEPCWEQHKKPRQ